eukprot:22707-Chlamydomonas_euryale.AAC.19
MRRQIRSPTALRTTLLRAGRWLGLRGPPRACRCDCKDGCACAGASAGRFCVIMRTAARGGGGVDARVQVVARGGLLRSGLLHAVRVPGCCACGGNPACSGRRAPKPAVQLPPAAQRSSGTAQQRVSRKHVRPLHAPARPADVGQVVVADPEPLRPPYIRPAPPPAWNKDSLARPGCDSCAARCVMRDDAYCVM